MNGHERFEGGAGGDRLDVSWRSDGSDDFDKVLITTASDRPGDRIGSARALRCADLDRLISTLQRARRDAYGNGPPVAVTVEIVERGRTSDATGTGSLIVPNEVRINGQQVYTQGGVRLHDAEYGKRGELATVTMTLPVRMLVVAAEHDIHRCTEPDDSDGSVAGAESSASADSGG